MVLVWTVLLWAIAYVVWKVHKTEKARRKSYRCVLY